MNDSLVFLVRYTPFGSQTGVERFAGSLALEIAQRGLNVYVVSGDGIHEVSSKGRRQLYTNLADPPVVGTIHFNMTITEKLRILFKTNRIRGVICHGAGPAIGYYLASRRFRGKARFFYYAHDCLKVEFDAVKSMGMLQPEELLRYRFLIYLEQRAIKVSDLIVANSEATRKGLIKAYGADESKIRMIPLGISDKYGWNTTDITGSRKTCFLAIGAGNRRNIRVFLAALHLLRNDYGIDAQGIVLRDRDPSHRELSRQLAIDVQFVDNVTDEQMKKLYQGAIALVIPSYREGFCLPVVEAAALGKPTIASNVGSLSELIDDGVDGILLDELSPGAIARAMKDLTSDGLALKMGESARRKASRFVISNVASELISACDER